MKCAFCGEREASGFEDGRPVCSYCVRLAADPLELAWIQADEYVFLDDDGPVNLLFRVERLPVGVGTKRTDREAHPEQRYYLRRALLDRMPFGLAVTEEERAVSYASPCVCAIVYRVTEDSVRWLRKNGLLRRGVERPCVCPCMGSLTEP